MLVYGSSVMKAIFATTLKKWRGQLEVTIQKPQIGAIILQSTACSELDFRLLDKVLVRLYG